MLDAISRQDSARPEFTKIISRAEAKAKGLKHYFTGKACKWGHVVQRYVSTCVCVVCAEDGCRRRREEDPDRHNEYARKWREANPEKARENSRKSYHADIERTRELKRDRYAADPEKHRAYTRKWKRSSNPEKARAKHRRRKYGLEPHDLSRILARQSGKCAICQAEMVDGSLRNDGLVVDHCHASGQVRGLLCNKCNKGLGHFNDKPELLRAAATYLTNTPQPGLLAQGAHPN